MGGGRVACDRHALLRRLLIVPEALWLLARLRPRRPAVVASLVPAVVLLAHLPLVLAQRDNGEAVTGSSLVARIAGMMERPVSYASVPIWIARLGAAINSRRKGGGVTPTVIDVITTSETVAHNADTALGVTLTPLSKTLDKIVTSWRRTT